MLKRKTILCFCIILSMICSSFGVVFAQNLTESASPQSFVVHHADDFESFNEGATSFSGYSGANKGNIWKIIKTQKSKALYMEINTQSDMHLDKNFTSPIDGRVIIEADVTIGKYANLEHVFQIRDSNKVELELCRFIGNTLVLCDGTVAGGFVEGKSYRISFGIDFDTKTYDVYFNNKKRIIDHPMQDKNSVSNISMFRIHMRNPKEFGNMTIDNLKLYSSDKPLTDAEFELKKSPSPSVDNEVLQDVSMSVDTLNHK